MTFVYFFSTGCGADISDYRVSTFLENLEMSRNFTSWKNLVKKYGPFYFKFGAYISV